MHKLIQVALTAAVAGIVQSGPAGCSSRTAALNSLITCIPSVDSVSIPAGQYLLGLNIVGGGGGGGRFANAPGNGGRGQLITGFVSLPSSTASLKLSVGRGGKAGTVPDFATYPGGRGGRGGNATAVYAYDASSNLIAVLAIAGGGGGAGGSDESNTGTGNGGDAGMDGSYGGYTGYYEAPAGTGAVGPMAGVGGPAVAGAYYPEAGLDGANASSALPPSTTAVQVGGRGAVFPSIGDEVIDMRGGQGGGGWASGGGGGESCNQAVSAVRFGAFSLSVRHFSTTQRYLLFLPPLSSQSSPL